ncbi:hypothetical protein ACFQT0_21650 [Hymenobacter humi]|uniref:Uncharacterized protein n=1 Tax=Hymenobacter humi TaxID=1411620 RepID=A0ABW2U9W0_9BACT
MHDLMTRLTFRIIARSVFSTNFPEAELDRLADLITEIQAFFVRSIRQPYLKPWFQACGAGSGTTTPSRPSCAPCWAATSRSASTPTPSPTPPRPTTCCRCCSTPATKTPASP